MLGFRIALAALLLVAPSLSNAAPQERTSQLQASVELLGAGGQGSVYGSYWIVPTLPIALNLGLGYSAVYEFAGGDRSFVTSPLYFSLFYGQGSHLLDVSLGGVFSTTSLAAVDAAESNAADALGLSYASGLFGVGYRMWPLKVGFISA